MLNRGGIACTFLLLCGLSGCGGDATGESTTPNAHNPDNPSPQPTLVPVVDDDLYAAFELYGVSSDDVYMQAQFANKPLAETSSANDFIDLDDGVVGAVWASVGQSINQLDLTDDLFDSLATVSEFSARFNEIVADAAFFNSAVDTSHTWYGSRLPYRADESYFVTTELSGGTYLDQTYVVLPRPFQIHLPGGYFSRSTDPLEVSWTPVEAGVEVIVQVMIVCAEGGPYRLIRPVSYDEGFMIFDAGVFDREALIGTCAASVAVTKRRLGELDSYLAGGSIAGNQVRVGAIVSTE